MKKAIAMLLALMLCLGLFAGCGQEAEAPQEDTEGEGEEVSQETSLLGEDNVRETTLYPRDLSRLEP